MTDSASPSPALGEPPAQPVACEVRRSNRKTLALHVSHRRILVRCPLWASSAEVQAFIAGHRKWIERRLQEEAQRDREALKIEAGGIIFYKARELRIEFRKGRQRQVLVEPGRFVVLAPQPDAATARRVIRDWLMAQARDCIVPRAHGLARHIGVEDRIRDIRFRKTRSKWGHCTSRGVLQYNWLIMLAPDSIIDYMITHEVCHLIHMNHSRRYWRLVASICPRYKEYVGWLKQHEHRFWFD